MPAFGLAYLFREDELFTIYERCEQKHIVHENTYRNMEGDELREMFAYKCKNSTYEEWCSAFCNRKYNSDFSKEMSKSVKEYLEQFR